MEIHTMIYTFTSFCPSKSKIMQRHKKKIHFLNKYMQMIKTFVHKSKLLNMIIQQIFVFVDAAFSKVVSIFHLHQIPPCLFFEGGGGWKDMAYWFYKKNLSQLF